MRSRRTSSRASSDVFEVVVGGERLVVLSSPARARSAAGRRLSPAERVVALDAASGLSNVQIAKLRDRSPRTIANQLASVYRKLRVASRAELVARLQGDS